MSIKMLASEFVDEYWDTYVKACKTSYKLRNVNIPSISDKLGIPEDITIVMQYRLGVYADEWLNTMIPALEDKKPIDLLHSDEISVKALKEALLRMPD